MIYINPSLSKALRAKDLLSGNDLSEGWGSQYTGNPRSLSLFLPTNAIKISPINAEVSLSQETSVGSNSSSQTVGSSDSEETLSRKHSNVLDQVKSNVKKVRYVENRNFSTENNISSKPSFSSPDSHLDALEILKKRGAIQVIYPKQGSGQKVNPPTSAVTHTEIKNTLYSAIFSQFTHKFSNKNLENVSDLL